MAGVKGKSGGPRKNAGGARPGAGRKPKEKAPPPLIEGDDTLKLLQDIAFGRVPDATNIQVRAAIAAVQYTHTKKGEGGKRDEVAEAAKKAAAGKYGARSGPRLVSSK